jgi:hypothetical protein
MGGMRPAAVAALALAAVAAAAPAGARTPIRAAYFYDYMPLDHVDALAAARFNRGVVRLIPDSVGSDLAERLGALCARGRSLGLLIVPDILVQSRVRLAALPTTRRYTWGHGQAEPAIGCPLDSLHWQSALIDHLDEVIAAVPGLTAVAVDLELYDAGRKHYDGGACRCRPCLAEYTGGAPPPADQSWRLSGLLAYQEARLTGLFTALLQGFAARHPGVELGVLDLDLDSFVHRALGRGLRRARVPTVDYSERSYRAGGAAIPSARGRLDALGLEDVPLVGGLWLKRWHPREVASGVRSVLERADGYFVFTTYSLWLDPSRLDGPYTLPGPPADYWRAFREVNHTP